VEPIAWELLLISRAAWSPSSRTTQRTEVSWVFVRWRDLGEIRSADMAGDLLAPGDHAALIAFRGGRRLPLPPEERLELRQGEERELAPVQVLRGPRLESHGPSSKSTGGPRTRVHSPTIGTSVAGTPRPQPRPGLLRSDRASPK